MTDTLRQSIEALLAEVRAEGWQPIATAPSKLVRYVLRDADDYLWVGQYDYAEQSFGYFDKGWLGGWRKATHWRPLRIEASAKLDAAVRALLDRVEQAEAQRDEARKFGENAAAEYNKLLELYQTVTCAFCGHEFPRGTPRHGDGALAEHIKTCPDHPLRAAEAQVAALSKFTQHLPRCLARPSWPIAPSKCSCGLDAVSGAQEPKG